MNNQNNKYLPKKSLRQYVSFDLNSIPDKICAKSHFLLLKQFVGLIWYLFF